MKPYQLLISTLGSVIDYVVVFLTYGALGGAFLQGLAFFLGIELTEANEFRLALLMVLIVFWEWKRDSVRQLFRQFRGEA